MAVFLWSQPQIFPPLLLGENKDGLYDDLPGNFKFGEQALLRVKREYSSSTAYKLR